MQDFTITTLGCKVNQYDSQAVAAALQQAGLRPAGGKKADLVVINTCCVTTTAMRKSRQIIRKTLRKSPGAAVIILGCYATYHEDRLRELLEGFNVPPERRLIVGHHDNVSARLEGFLPGRLAGQNCTKEITNPPGGSEITTPATMQRRRTAAVSRRAEGTGQLPGINGFPGHQRAFVKVQDGCDAFCSYCIVCYTRPRVTSRSIETILAECRTLVEAGYKEIVLCGVFLGAFGRDTAIRRHWPANQPSQLPKLLASVANIPGLWRVRLSSLEPGDMTDELLEVIASQPAVAPHLHLPLQSGSAKILRRMNRQYSPREFCQTVDLLRSKLDRPAITTDVIVGFPGEGEEEFAETLAVARHGRLAKIHAFPFSAIEPTVAWRDRNEAPQPEVVRKRLNRLAELEATLAREYHEQFIGCQLEGLVESTIPQPGLRQAMTDRYMTVQFAAAQSRSAARPDIVGQVVKLKITSATPISLAASLHNIDV